MSGERERVNFMIRVVVSLVRRLFHKVDSTASSAVRAFRSGHSRPCVLDLLTRHAAAHPPFPPPSARPRLSPILLPCMADSFSLLIDDSSPSSLTSPLPTHSQYPTFSRAGTHASPSLPARHSPVSREMVAVFMLHLWMVPHFPFSGGVRYHPTFFTFARLHLYPCRKRHSIIRYRRRSHHIRPSARRSYKFLHLAFYDG